MAEDTGNRADFIEENSGTMEPQNTLVVPTMGWCLHCTCRPHYHVSDTDGTTKCLNCKCVNIELDRYREDLDKKNLENWPCREAVWTENSVVEVVDADDDIDHYPLEVVEDSGDIEEFTNMPWDAAIEARIDVFIGEVSRGCASCGQIKLYKDFNNSTDPNDLCNFCLYEQSEIEIMDESLSDFEREELLDTEDEIIENEMAWYEAQERQELIDEVLRGLDE